MSKEETLLKTIKGGKGIKKMSLGETTNFLKHNRVDLNILDPQGYNMLHYAIKTENYDLVNLFLNLDEENYITEKASPNVLTSNEKDGIYLSPILLALHISNDSTTCYKIIRSLIKAGGDLSKKDEEGCSLYLRAAEKGKIDILEYLMSTENLNFNLNETCSTGSALHFAIIGDQEETISSLLNNKIDISLVDSGKNTALHLALQLKMNNAFKLIQDYLISCHELTDDQKKAIFNSQNEDGNTIVHELAFAKCHFMIELVKKFPSQYAVDLEITNNEGLTYKGVQENIIEITKKREANEKLLKEEIKRQKEKIAEEKRQEALREKEYLEQMRIEEEKRQKMGQFLIKYRGVIFGIFLIIFMIVLYLLVNNATKKKAKII